MKLEVKKIQDTGDIAKERIILEATEDLDVGKHVVFATRRPSDSKGVLGGLVPHCFWLPDKDVSKGDLVVIYTKSGDASSKKNVGGNSSYFFYWGLKEPVWRERKAVVVEILRWKALPVEEEKSTEEVKAEPAH